MSFLKRWFGVVDRPTHRPPHELEMSFSGVITGVYTRVCADGQDKTTVTVKLSAGWGYITKDFDVQKGWKPFNLRPGDEVQFHAYVPCMRVPDNHYLRIGTSHVPDKS